ncbi:hypothetical protein KC351_g36 [Hortaea werneckii]|nr:hypothetical protein KC351_g36 [Hortaea werneckii]
MASQLAVSEEASAGHVVNPSSSLSTPPPTTMSKAFDTTINAPTEGSTSFEPIRLTVRSSRTERLDADYRTLQHEATGRRHDLIRSQNSVRSGSKTSTNNL